MLFRSDEQDKIHSGMVLCQNPDDDFQGEESKIKVVDDPEGGLPVGILEHGLCAHQQGKRDDGIVHHVAEFLAGSEILYALMGHGGDWFGYRVYFRGGIYGNGRKNAAQGQGDWTLDSGCWWARLIEK